jgi:hypothetical protein
MSPDPPDRPAGPLEQLTADNDAHWASLAAHGPVIAQGPFGLMRLTVLVEMLLGEQLPAAELEFQIRLSRLLDELDAKLAQARRQQALIVPTGPQL